MCARAGQVFVLFIHCAAFRQLRTDALDLMRAACAVLKGDLVTSLIALAEANMSALSQAASAGARCRALRVPCV